MAAAMSSTFDASILGLICPLGLTDLCQQNSWHRTKWGKGVKLVTYIAGQTVFMAGSDIIKPEVVSLSR